MNDGLLMRDGWDDRGCMIGFLLSLFSHLARYGTCLSQQKKEEIDILLILILIFTLDFHPAGRQSAVRKAR